MNNKNPVDLANTITRWGIMLFLAYIFWNASGFGTSKTSENKIAPTPGNQQVSKEQDCNKKFSFPLASLPLFPSYVPAVRIQNTTPGTGEPLVCGQKTKLQYEYSDSEGHQFKKATEEVVIGEGKLLKGMELGLLETKAGGTRKITIPLELAYFSDTSLTLPAEAKGKAIIADASVNEIITKLPDSSLPLRAMNVKMGSGQHVQCGDRIVANIAVWKLDGTQLFDSGEKPVSFVYGRSQLPYGVEQGVVNLMEGGENTVIIPPSYNKPLIADTKSLLPLALPDNEILVGRIAVVSINSAMAVREKK